MRQILHSFKTGEVELVEVPAPRVGRGELLIRTTCSLISTGTERMLMEFGQASYLAKARQQPDKVRQVLDKVRTEGLFETVSAVRSKLAQPIPLGYCNAGIVVDVGDDVSEFEVGDRVVSNGSHAELVRVPKNLCAKIPDAVSDQDAAFVVAAAIGLQGLRLAAPTLGERFVVTGLGLIGLLTVQMLRAQGCAVLGVDLDPAKLALAQAMGAEVVNATSGDPVAAAAAFSRGRGVDGVIITASTKSNEPAHQAAQMCRKRGRIVLVGAVGLELQRADFYEKELSFQVSCSYGPGRYDASYEEQGLDYPFGLVRWTEQRNFEAVLQLLADGGLQVSALVSHQFPIEQATQAYTALGGADSPIAILLDYPSHDGAPLKTVSLPGVTERVGAAGEPSVSIIGAGNFAMRTLLPALRKCKVQRVAIASNSGTTAFIAARTFGFARSTTDLDELIADESVNTIFILTRHDTHADLVLRCIEAGKNVFVEKPLAINEEQLAAIEAAHERRSKGTRVMVGFNRRFAPLVGRMRALLTRVSEPTVMVYTVNAGAIPASHWIQAREQGGGRIIGEGCHFIDLARYLADAPITKMQAMTIGDTGAEPVVDDKMTITVGFANGSMATIHYLANGHRSFPKERVEVFCGGRVLQLDNFRRLSGFGWSGFKSESIWRMDKGHAAGISAFLDSIREGGEAPIPFRESVEVTRATFRAMTDALMP